MNVQFFLLAAAKPTVLECEVSRTHQKGRPDHAACRTGLVCFVDFLVFVGRIGPKASGAFQTHCPDRFGPSKASMFVQWGVVLMDPAGRWELGTLKSMLVSFPSYFFFVLLYLV